MATTRRVQPGRLAALRPLVAVAVRQGPRTRRRPVLLAGLVGLLVVAARRRSPHGPRPR